MHAFAISHSSQVTQMINAQAARAATSVNLAMLTVRLDPTESDQSPPAASLGFWVVDIQYAASSRTQATVRHLRPCHRSIDFRAVDRTHSSCRSVTLAGFTRHHDCGDWQLRLLRC